MSRSILGKRESLVTLCCQASAVKLAGVAKIDATLMMKTLCDAAGGWVDPITSLGWVDLR